MLIILNSSKVNVWRYTQLKANCSCRKREQEIIQVEVVESLLQSNILPFKKVLKYIHLYEEEKSIWFIKKDAYKFKFKFEKNFRTFKKWILVYTKRCS